jgi:membrane-associated protease RseP (regulator of RpoE activity)
MWIVCKTHYSVNNPQKRLFICARFEMKQNYPLHIFLFLVTVFTTMMAGAEWASGRFFYWGDPPHMRFDEIWMGIPFSFSFLLFLTVHEFGHYFTAVYHKVNCSLPYYIPIFIPVAPLNIGSFGAVIRIREVPSSRRKYFDIGVAGPLAGFVVALGLLIFGFTQLPPLEEYVLGIHPDYLAKYGGVPTPLQIATGPDAGGSMMVSFGGSLLYEFLAWILPNKENLPPSFEIMHYPYIFVGFLTMFFTALNLLPIGQLDGGHVTYGLFGAKRAGMISRITVLALIFVGGTGLVAIDPLDLAIYNGTWDYLLWQLLKFLLYFGFLYYALFRMFRKVQPRQLFLGVLAIGGVQAISNLIFHDIQSNVIWLVYAFMSVRLVGVDHPIAPDDTPLTTKQKILGWLAILIFILCFTPNPISVA